VTTRTIVPIFGLFKQGSINLILKFLQESNICYKKLFCSDAVQS
jgi:hypothetical protein